MLRTIGRFRTGGGASAPAGPTALPQSGSIVARWSADDITPQADNTELPSWTSTVGGIVASQATSAKRPRYRTNRLGTKPSVMFTASSQQQLSMGSPAAITTPMNAHNYGILLVFRTTGTDTGAIMDIGLNVGGGMIMSNGGTTVGSFTDSYMGQIPFAGQTGFSTLLVTGNSYTNGQGTFTLERWYLNGTCVGHAGTGYAGPSTGNLAFGGDAANAAFVNWTGELFDVVVWGATVTPPNAIQAHKWACDKYSQTYPWAGGSYFYVNDGDSIDMGIGGAGPVDSMPYKVAQSLGLTYGQWTNIAVGGDTVANMTTRAATETDLFLAQVSKPIKYYGMEWYNQRGASPTPYNNSVAFINARKAANPSNFKVCWGTSTDTSATTDTDRANYNSAFDSNHSMCDSYVAIHLNAQIGTETANANFPGNWSDGVHLSAAGYTVYAPLVVTGLNAL